MHEETSTNTAPVHRGTTGIEWAEKTWNPVTGCDKISPGCKFCYAETLAKRLQLMAKAQAEKRGGGFDTAKYRNGFAVTLHPSAVNEPVKWRTPGAYIFVNSMSDLLHKDVPTEFILDVFHTMAVRAPWLRYFVLTKRADRWIEISRLVMERYGAWPRNILPGVSVENRKHGRPRIDMLGQVGDEHTVRMLSVEPLLEGLIDPEMDRDDGVIEFADQLARNRIGWVITGGESAWHPRLPAIQDFIDIRDACQAAGVPYFHKQHGGALGSTDGKRGKDKATLEGQLYHAMPSVWFGSMPSERSPRLF
jgi:protein gp37